MGEGTFGRVLECWDRDAEELVAIKVVRSAEKYREAAMIEVDVLRTLGKHDKTGSRSVFFDFIDTLFVRRVVFCGLIGMHFMPSEAVSR